MNQLPREPSLVSGGADEHSVEVLLGRVFDDQDVFDSVPGRLVLVILNLNRKLYYVGNINFRLKP